jgi:hypothetical protein
VGDVIGTGRGGPGWWRWVSQTAWSARSAGSNSRTSSGTASTPAGVPASRPATGAPGYRAAIAAYRQLGNLQQATTTLVHLGEVHEQWGDLDQARAAWPDAVAQYRRQNRDTDADAVRSHLRRLMP